MVVCKQYACKQSKRQYNQIGKTIIGENGQGSIYLKDTWFLQAKQIISPPLQVKILLPGIAQMVAPDLAGAIVNHKSC